MADKLTDKQERFCQEYMIDSNATQAAIRAGYSAKTAQEQGSQHLSKLIIQTRIKELQDKLSSKLQITAEKVLRDIEAVRVRCMQGEPVLDREGNPTGEWKFEAHAALKASELQGKHIKLFNDKSEGPIINIKTEVKIEAVEIEDRISQLKGKK